MSTIRTVVLPADQVEALLAVDGDAWLAVEADCSHCGKPRRGHETLIGEPCTPAWCVGKCETCKGDGTRFAGPNGVATHLIPCPDCQGSGLRRVEIGVQCGEPSFSSRWSEHVCGDDACRNGVIRRATFEVIEVLEVRGQPGVEPDCRHCTTKRFAVGFDQATEVWDNYLTETGRWTRKTITPIGTPEPGHYVVRLRQVQP